MPGGAFLVRCTQSGPQVKDSPWITFSLILSCLLECSVSAAIWLFGDEGGALPTLTPNWRGKSGVKLSTNEREVDEEDCELTGIEAQTFLCLDVREKFNNRHHNEKVCPG